MASAMCTLILFALLSLSLRETSGAETFNYSHFGSDWTAGSCVTGMRQSPINIVSTRAQQMKMNKYFKFMYQTSSTVTLLHKGTTVQVLPESGTVSTLTIGKDQIYNFLQLHFHVPSEHMVDGRYSAMEAHFVHANQKNKSDLAVFGVLFDLDPNDKPNPVIQKYWTNFPAGAGLNTTIASSSNFIELFLPKLLKKTAVKLDYYKYLGSLTTPSCDENVTWHVLTEHRTVSLSQVLKFSNVIQQANAGIPVDNRHVQPLHGRQIRNFPATQMFSPSYIGRV